MSSFRKQITTYRLSEIWRHRDLIMLFVRRDFVSVFKQMILGLLWFLIQPLFTALVFTIVFGRAAKISTDSNNQLMCISKQFLLF
jgi:lipopolysaccharide transport system permease protein